MVADYVIIPVECDLFGVQGLYDFYEPFVEFQEDNENLKILGILKVKYKEKQNLTKELEDAVLPKYASDMKTKVLNSLRNGK